MSNKSIDELTFIDDYMFGVVMRDPEVCKGVLERLLHIKVDHIEYPELQKQIKATYESKGVRFDVYVDDGKTVYDIEMENHHINSIGKRTRYYQSLIDVDQLFAGMDYRKLKESYVIFICKKDPFGLNLQRYSFEETCQENNNAKLNDFSHKVIYNASAYENEKDEQLKNFLSFVCNNKPVDSFTQRLTEIVQKVKENETFRTEYLKMNIHDVDIKDEGRQEGIQKTIIETAKKMLSKNYKDDEIIDCTGITPELLNSIKES